MGQPTPEQRDATKKLVADVGMPAAAERLGLAPATVARVIAGLRTQRGTIAVLELAFRAEGDEEAAA